MTKDIWNLPPTKSRTDIKPLGEDPTEPCPDPSKPYVWFDGEWILMETDSEDDDDD